MGYEFEFAGMEQPQGTKEDLSDGLEDLSDRTSDTESADDIIKNLSDLKDHMDGWENAGDIIRNLREMDGDKYEDVNGDSHTEIISSTGEAAEGFEDGENEAMQDISEAASEWHLQESDMSCAVASQEFIINEFTGSDVTEAELSEYAEVQGWYTVEGGTTLDNVGNLLEVYGIETTTIESGATLSDLESVLSEGGRAIVAVNAEAITTEYCDCYPVFSCDHAIEVLGMDREKGIVIINDPGVTDGCAKEVSIENFTDAWATSGGYMTAAARPQ